MKLRAGLVFKTVPQGSWGPIRYAEIVGVSDMKVTVKWWNGHFGSTDWPIREFLSRFEEGFWVWDEVMVVEQLIEKYEGPG